LTGVCQRDPIAYGHRISKTVVRATGIPCLELEEIAPNKQQIVCSRSFSRRLTQYSELSAALAEFCSRAAGKLRRQQSLTGCITVFIRTNPFNPHEPQYQPSASVKLDAATQDTRTIISTANRLLREIFKAGYGYHKCGVQLSHIQPESSPGQLELFAFAGNGLPAENRPLMKVVDQINRRFPKAISVAATGFDQSWKAKAERVSPRSLYDGLAGVGWRQMKNGNFGFFAFTLRIW
jgi:DNA polymerase V